MSLDAYYGYNFKDPVGRVNLLRAYDVSSNAFSLNQAAVIFERAPDLDAGRRFGARLDLQFGQATATLQGNPVNEPRPGIYRNIFQAYGTYVIPVGSGLTVDFGKWASSLGIEGNYTQFQINYSRSYWFNFLPFYHMGIRTQYIATLIFCQSHATASMLYRWLGVRSQVLRPPAAVRDFRQSSAWSEIASQLLGAALTPQSARAPDKTRVTVLDVQPIDPPTGGGRLRLLGLYHALGEHIDCRYVGTYDLPGGTRRSHRVSPCLDATYVPLSLAHHKVADQLRAETGGKTVFDVSFSRLAHLSPAFVSAARESIKDASIIVFSHPWVYPLVADVLTQRQLVVYDSHNVEGYLRAQLLDRNNPTQATLLRQVLSDEYALGNRADLIFACSQEDLERFARIYDVPFEKLRIVPNGAMAEQGIELDRKSARHQLKLQQDKPIAIFVGSAFGPNLEAAHFIINRLADILPEMTFVIAGSVGNDLQCEKRNVVVTGSLEEAEKLRWLVAADLGINPMCSGSGTNIKMFELMAMRLPIVSTAVGARGIDCGGRKSILIVDPDPDAFATAIRSLCDEQVRLEMGEAARACLEDGYAWERISPFAGAMMHAASDYGGQPKPFFSVVIPSYERPQGLDRLFQCLQAQVERDFEVIVVDQSKTRWRGADGNYGFPFRYWQTPVRGAVRARNTGASLAQGDILAFTDDDCLPEEFWLFNARKHFAEPSVAGIEGQIVSDHLGDPSWRPVTNSRWGRLWLHVGQPDGSAKRFSAPGRL